MSPSLLRGVVQAIALGACLLVVAGQRRGGVRGGNGGGKDRTPLPAQRTVRVRIILGPRTH